MPLLPPAFVVTADSVRFAQFRAAWAAVGLPADAGGRPSEVAAFAPSHSADPATVAGSATPPPNP